MIPVPMQTTPLQDRLIDSITFIVKSWKNSNDLSSPTVHIDIGEELQKFTYDGIDPDYLGAIETRLINVLDLLRYVDDYIEETV